MARYYEMCPVLEIKRGLEYHDVSMFYSVGAEKVNFSIGGNIRLELYLMDFIEMMQNIIDKNKQINKSTGNDQLVYDNGVHGGLHPDSWEDCKLLFELYQKGEY